MGIGMRFTMCSFTASMSHLSYAKISTMGNDSAAVPVKRGNQSAHDMRGGRMATFYGRGNTLSVLWGLDPFD